MTTRWPRVSISALYRLRFELEWLPITRIFDEQRKRLPVKLTVAYTAAIRWANRRVRSDNAVHWSYGSSQLALLLMLRVALFYCFRCCAVAVSCSGIESRFSLSFFNETPGDSIVPRTCSSSYRLLPCARCDLCGISLRMAADNVWFNIRFTSSK